MAANKTPTVIAIAGKGGVGKTTVAGLLIRRLAATGKRVLAVDADPNSNLNEVLGTSVGATLGEIRETLAHRELSGDPIPGGMSKHEYAQFMMGGALTEEDDYDLLVMGRTQGEGCYCYVNGLLTAQIERYAGEYDCIVADNEAGLEHISRGVLPKIDILLMVSDCSRRGIQAAARLDAMVTELKLNPKVRGLIVNRAPGGVLGDGIRDEIERHGLTLLGVLPQDEDVYRRDLDGEPTSRLPDDSAFKAAVNAVVDKLDVA